MHRKRHRTQRFFLLVLATLTLSSIVSAQTFSLQKHEAGVRVVHGEATIADYLTKSKTKPIIHPLLGPDGVKLTRDYPMVPDSQNEAHDHPHHRSFWFTHGEVNGHDFWAEGDKAGSIEHQEFTQLDDGEQAVIGTRNIWKSVDGQPLLSDHRRFTFGGDADVRWLDCEIELLATHGDVHFGDTKEGSFGIRMAESIKMDAKQGGNIVNSRGLTGGETWGQPAEWVDYYGPVDGKTYGIAILCHPSSFNFPNRWHVRTYGLFAANPFGVYHFTGDKEPTAGTTLTAGEKLTLKYRVVLHRGDVAEASISKLYDEYAQP